MAVNRYILRALALCIGSLLLSSSSALASWPGDNGRIAFGVIRSDHAVVLSTLPDGSDVQQVTSSAYSSREHSFSPDGNQILFSRELSQDQHDLFTQDADGSNVRRLTSRKLADVNASWSPDGSALIYSHQNRDGHYDIFTMETDGSNKSSLGAVKGNDFWPRWSPDGDAIAYIKGYHGLYLMDPDGSDRRILADWTHGHADWHPDGDRLVVETGGGPDGKSPGIYIVDETGLVMLAVVQQVGWTEPAFSPDGTKIVAQRYYKPVDDDMQLGIYTMNLDGTDLTLIRKTSWGKATHVDWQAL